MSHDDFGGEPVRGLPERPPEGERILWQGRPDAWALTRDSLNLLWVLGYFLALGLWRFLTLIDQTTLLAAFRAAFPFAILGAVVCALLLTLGVVLARTTVYTITTRRVAMRIGAALTVTLNLPFTQIRNADLTTKRDGTGSIALELLPDSTRLSYLVCWPHVRPWVMRRTQPALRCIPEADKVSAILADAAEARVNTPTIAEGAAPGAPVAAE